MPRILNSAVVLCCMIFMLAFTPTAHAASAAVINVKVDEAINTFYAKVNGASSLIKKAHGILVFPNVIKAGIGLGGEYGFR